MSRMVYAFLPLSCALLGLLLGCSDQPEVQEVDINKLPPDQLVFELIDQGDVENLATLLTDNPDLVNVRGNAGATPLQAAAAVGDPEVVKMLLDRGADPQLADEFGQTPLDAAKLAEQTAVVEMLEGR